MKTWFEISLAGLVLLVGCGGEAGAPEPKPNAPPDLLLTGFLAANGEVLTGYMDEKDRFFLVWGLPGKPKAELAIPAELVVLDAVVHGRPDGKELLYVAAWDRESGRSEVALWPHSTGPDLPPGPRVVIHDGSPGSVFRSLLVHGEDLLILDAAHRIVHRIVDTDGDGEWDAMARQPFASAALIGSVEPLYLQHAYTDSAALDPTRIQLGADKLFRRDGSNIAETVHYLIDADRDGRAEGLETLHPWEAPYAPVPMHSVVAGLETLTVGANPGSEVAIWTVGADPELLGAATADPEGATVAVRVVLTRLLRDRETIRIDNTSAGIQGEEITVEGHAVIITGSRVRVETTNSGEFDGWTVSLRGVGLHTGLIVEVASLLEDAPIESDPAGFPVTTNPDTGIDVRIPADRAAGRVHLVLSDGDEVVSGVEVVLEVNPR